MSQCQIRVICASSRRIKCCNNGQFLKFQGSHSQNQPLQKNQCTWHHVTVVFILFFFYQYLFLFFSFSFSFPFSHDLVSVPRNTLGQETRSIGIRVYKGRGYSIGSLALRLFLSSIDAISVSFSLELLVFSVLVVVSG